MFIHAIHPIFHLYFSPDFETNRDTFRKVTLSLSVLLPFLIGWVGGGGLSPFKGATDLPVVRNSLFQIGYIFQENGSKKININDTWLCPAIARLIYIKGIMIQ